MDDGEIRLESTVVPDIASHCYTEPDGIDFLVVQPVFLSSEACKTL